MKTILKHGARIGLALFVCAGSAFAADITWTGGGDGTNWSDGDNWGGTPPGSADRAILPDAPSGRSTVVDSPFDGTVQYVRIAQSTTSATQTISLSRELVMTSNNSTASGLEYTSTISNPAMIEWYINGNYLRFSSTSTGSKVNNLFGTFVLDTADSRIGTARYPGTATGDTDTFNFGSGSDLARVNVTANASIGRITTGSTQTDGRRLTTINVGPGSEVNISNNARLDMLQRTRVAANNIHTLAVNNSGTMNIAAGSTLGVVFRQVNASNYTVNTSLSNLVGGTINHNGTVAIGLHERGTATITNNGTWKAGNDAVITGLNNAAGADDYAMVTFTNESGGVVQNASSGSLTYTPLTDAAYLNQWLTLTNQGIISPGAGHNGTGTSSVGTFEMYNIDVTFSGSAATLRIDIGGASSGTYDQLLLNNGTLTLDSDSNLELYYVNDYVPSVGDSWTILGYTNRVGAFDLPSRLTIYGASGWAANPDNYSIIYNVDNAVLTLIPEPGSVILTGLGVFVAWLRRKVRRSER